MSEYLIQGETLTGIADAIRGKTGGTGPVAVSDMAAQIEGIQAGGGDDVLNALIGRSITEISSNATTIGSSAFSGCSNLTTADFPMATTIRNSAFNGCGALTTVDFPLVSHIDSSAFNGCGALTTVDFPLVSHLGSRAFNECEALTTAVFPLVERIRESVFNYCKALTTVDFPIATGSIDSKAFYRCEALTTVCFPRVTSIESNAFNYCITLTTADFPLVANIKTYVFAGCNVLTAIILRNTEQICTLSGTNAFSSTPIASGTGYIYVPSALIEQYKAATNWSTYAAQFRALEDYTVDGTTTGELDPTKIGT